ncbi:MAG: hypothetical protein A2161_01920 [Candidatus Schekmanbacteria bacterium RBG_13_48_7]|uniref:Uncharacterized protein n=1 Tax=Candidatus Schekmanbacteria bacterium RBG_13_48_7 TaxID=1817878 RepID=A0A1F7RSP6_9BACT|nr:MAG: hypothetical protein A2161_01920 [Candidatus Schekmanbacteria bacterium RBG_13_48_7]
MINLNIFKKSEFKDLFPLKSYSGKVCSFLKKTSKSDKGRISEVIDPVKNWNRKKSRNNKINGKYVRVSQKNISEHFFLQMWLNKKEYNKEKAVSQIIPKHIKRINLKSSRYIHRASPGFPGMSIDGYRWNHMKRPSAIPGKTSFLNDRLW